MNNKQIRALALEMGFKLKRQENGEMDLNPYVYAFAKRMYNIGLNLADGLDAEVERLKTENERLKDDLYTHGGHDQGCNALCGEQFECECGWTKTAKEWGIEK